MTDETFGHAEAFELLPWLVNGTLRDEERERIDRHVAACLVCRAEIKAQSGLKAFVSNQPTVSWSAENGYERLARRLNETTPADGERRLKAASVVHGVAHMFRGPLRIAGLASVAATLALVAWLGVDRGSTGGSGSFTTLTGTAASASLLVDIVFAAGVSEADRRELLDELGATVVAGPSEVGRLTVRLRDVTLESDRDALITALQADPRVRLAARNFTLEQPGGGP